MTNLESILATASWSDGWKVGPWELEDNDRIWASTIDASGAIALRMWPPLGMAAECISPCSSFRVSRSLVQHPIGSETHDPLKSSHIRSHHSIGRASHLASVGPSPHGSRIVGPN